MICSTLKPAKVIRETPLLLLLRHTATACGTNKSALQIRPSPNKTATICFNGCLLSCTDAANRNAPTRLRFAITSANPRDYLQKTTLSGHHKDPKFRASTTVDLIGTLISVLQYGSR